MVKIMKYILDFSKYDIPDHTALALENYFIHGYSPGSFVTYVMCNNLYGAVNSADSINQSKITDIVSWLMHSVPMNSYGSINKMNRWISDIDGCRSQFTTRMKENKFFNTLSDNS